MPGSAGHSTPDALFLMEFIPRIRGNRGKAGALRAPILGRLAALVKTLPNNPGAFPIIPNNSGSFLAQSRNGRIKNGHRKFLFIFKICYSPELGATYRKIRILNLALQQLVLTSSICSNCVTRALAIA
jgi:hypothetical protein